MVGQPRIHEKKRHKKVILPESVQNTHPVQQCSGNVGGMLQENIMQNLLQRFRVAFSHSATQINHKIQVIPGHYQCSCALTGLIQVLTVTLLPVSMIHSHLQRTISTKPFYSSQLIVS